jgi:hypothetical protein
LVARIVAVLVLLVAVAGWVPKPAAAQDVTCADYDAWEWAQSVFESNPEQYAALDPNGDGVPGAATRRVRARVLD